jgi:hypothetical protein
MLRRSNEAPGGNQVWQWRESTIYAEMLLDMGDANFELEPLVDFAVFEFAQLGVDAIELCDSTPIIPTLNDGFRLSARCLVVGSALCASLISPRVRISVRSIIQWPRWAAISSITQSDEVVTICES